MSPGRVEAIHIAPVRGEPPLRVEQVRAIAGVGLEGDRYALGAGTWSRPGSTGRALTLVEAESLEGLAMDFGIELAPGETRRNITTRGIRLNELVGRHFRIGHVLCLGVKLCEPCTYLEALTGKPIREPLVHRAGLRADILGDGVIAVGDPIVAFEGEPFGAAAPPSPLGDPGDPHDPEPGG